MAVPLVYVPMILMAVIDGAVRLWAWVRNFCHNHHVAAMLLLTWATIRFSIKAVSSTFNLIVRIGAQSSGLVTNAQAQGGGLSWLSTFGCVNAIFPVFELFIFLSALMGLKGSLWLLNWLRYAYKQIPLKSS